MLQIKVNETTAARRRIPVVLVDGTDGLTAETGVTLSSGDMKISKNGASEANHAGSLVELAGGGYYYEATADEVDTIGYFVGRIIKSGVRTFWAAAQVVSFDPYASTPTVSDTAEAVADQTDIAAAIVDIATLISRLTALRAGYLDNLSAGAVALASSILDAAGIRTAVGLASANLDTQLSNINSKTTNLPSDPADQSLIVDATNALATLLGSPAGASLAADIAALKAVADSVLADTGTDGVPLTSTAINAVRDAIFARTFSSAYNSLTFDQMVKLVVVAAVAKVSGMDANSPVFRNLADNADVITGTSDANGNRTAVTLNP